MPHPIRYLSKQRQHDVVLYAAHTAEFLKKNPSPPPLFSSQGKRRTSRHRTLSFFNSTLLLFLFFSFFASLRFNREGAGRAGRGHRAFLPHFCPRPAALLEQRPGRHKFFTYKLFLPRFCPRPAALLEQRPGRHKFSKTPCILPLYRKCTRALTFENV